MISTPDAARSLPTALALLTASAAWTSPVAAQETESPLSPAGRLRLDFAPSVIQWDSRFGLREEGGTAVRGGEPLGFDLVDPDGYGIFPGAADLPGTVRDLVGDPQLPLPLGASRAEVSAERIRLPFRLDVGVFDWLTVGVTVPLERNRTEVTHLLAADSSDVGISPSVTRSGEVSAFLDDVARALSDLEAAGGDPGLEAEVADFLEGLTGLYRSSALFPAQGTAAGDALGGRLAALNGALQDAGVTAVGPPVPLATAPVTDASGVADLLTGPGFGYRSGPTGLPGVWALGDVEVHAVAGVLGGTGPDTAAGRAGLRWEVGAGGLLRLPTGTTSDPDLILDLGSGDGQTDLEARVFANVTAGRMGLWADGRYGIQSATTLVRRVAPPDQVLSPLTSRRPVEWTPGRYLRLEVAPRLHLTPELAIMAAYRYASKDDDEYVEAGAAPDEPTGFVGYVGPVWDAAVLSRETGWTTHELGGGLIFSTVESWRGGRTSLPFEIRFSVRKAVSGAGGRTPEALTAQMGLRVYRRVWGGG